LRPIAHPKIAKLPVGTPQDELETRHRPPWRAVAAPRVQHVRFTPNSGHVRCN
jgi:hypothetical protein